MVKLRLAVSEILVWNVDDKTTKAALRIGA
jgi:hypothetical protein